MKINEKKLEEWLKEIPQCRKFLNNFFVSCEGLDSMDCLVNYISDLRSYSKTRAEIRDNYDGLLRAFEEISGLRVYRE